jgi:Domain of unknown function (DUF1772)
MTALEVITVLLVALAMSLALAHALELPGKMRLSRETYMAVQRIYYPGFTIGGIGEIAAVIATLALAILSDGRGARFWLLLGAFAATLAMHAAYWLLTHPVNKFWVEGFDMGKAGAGFFAFTPVRRAPNGNAGDWTALRDRWEWSHVFRAALSVIGLALLVTAVAM